MLSTLHAVAPLNKQFARPRTRQGVMLSDNAKGKLQIANDSHRQPLSTSFLFKSFLLFAKYLANQISDSIKQWPTVLT